MMARGDFTLASLDRGFKFVALERELVQDAREMVPI